MSNQERFAPTRCLELKVARKKRSYATLGKVGIYVIIAVSICDVMVTESITYHERDDADSVPFSRFKFLWSIDLVMYLIKGSMHLFSLFLILKATHIMKKIANKSGNPESTKDIRQMITVGILCFIAFCVDIIGMLIGTIL